MSNRSLVVPTVEVDHALIERHGIRPDQDISAIASYLTDRNLTATEVAGTHITITSGERFSPELGRYCLGTYERGGNITLYGRRIAAPSPWRMRRTRPDGLPALGSWWQDASLSERFNYVLTHELEHRIDDVTGRLESDVCRSYAAREKVRRRESIVTAVSAGVPAVAAYVGSEICLDAPPVVTVLAGLALSPLGMWANIKATKRLRDNEYLLRPHEIRAHMAGMLAARQLISVEKVLSQ